MRSYKRYTRRKRLLKHIVVVALVFILGLVLLRAVSYIAIQDEGYSRWEAKERAEEYIESLR